MNKKTIVAFAVAALAGLAMARPGPGGFHGGFGGHRGGFHHGGFHHGGFHHGYRGGFYGGHHHYHRGWGYGLGAAAVALGTAAVVRDIVAPRTVVYSSYGTPVYSSYPYSTTYVAPVVYPPSVTYGVPPPPPPPPPPRW